MCIYEGGDRAFATRVYGPHTRSTLVFGRIGGLIGAAGATRVSRSGFCCNGMCAGLPFFWAFFLTWRAGMIDGGLGRGVTRLLQLGWLVRCSRSFELKRMCVVMRTLSFSLFL